MTFLVLCYTMPTSKTTHNHIWQSRGMRCSIADLCVANGEENLAEQDEGARGESVQVSLVGQQQCLAKVAPAEHTTGWLI